MIVKEVKGNSGKGFIVVPQDADDLFIIRRTVEKEDSVTANTTRLIKHFRQYGRAEKGERVKIRVSLRAENTALYDAVDRLRITGVITNTDNELVPKGTHHSVTVRIDDTIMIQKERKWHKTELDILTSSGKTEDFVLVAIDTQEAAVAKVSGTHLNVIPNIYSWQSGKRYNSLRKSSPGLETFFREVLSAIQSAMNLNSTARQIRILIFGPGETKRKLNNFLHNEKYQFEGEMPKLIDGVDVAGEDGIHVFLRSAAFKEAMNSSKLAAVTAIIDEVLRLVHTGQTKFALGVEEVARAASLKNIEGVVISDAIFKTTNEETIFNLLNSIESNGGKIYAVDSSTDVGLRVSSLGGVLALLRYSLR